MTLELRTRIGIITPDDAVNDDEYWKFVDNDVTLLIDRYRTPQRFDPIGPDMVASYAGLDLLEESSETLRITRPEAVVFFCNSCSFVGGKKANQEICDAMARSAQAPATTVSSAQVEALKSLGVRRVSIGAPYQPEVTKFLISFLEEHDFDVIASHSLGMTTEWEIGNSPPSVWESLAHQVDRPEAEAILLACTGIRTSSIIERTEVQLEKPLVTAPAAGIWHALRLAGYQRQSTGHGRLFTK